MPEFEIESSYVERGLENIKNLIKKPTIRSKLNLAGVKEKLAEHAKIKTPLEDAARRVFVDYVAPRLFHAGEAKAPKQEPGLQTEVTPEIEGFVLDALKHFKTKGVLDFLKRHPENLLPAVKKIVREIHDFERVPLEGNVAKQLYAKQTAHDVISTKMIPTTTVYAFGCAHASVALVGALKALGIKSVFVRTLPDYERMIRSPKQIKPDLRYPHSVVLFELAGKKYIADPWGAAKVMKVTPEMERRINKMKEMKEKTHLWSKGRWWLEGEDMWGVGITSYKYFTKGLSLPKEVKRRMLK